MFETEEPGYSTKIVLFTDEECTGPEISMVTNYYDRKIEVDTSLLWKGIDGITFKIHKHKSIKITDDIEKRLLR